MIRYQGESIDFSIEMEKLKPTDVEDWSQFASVVVYLYTQTSYLVKFSNKTMSGYEKLTMSTDKKAYTGRLSSKDTKLMSGALTLDIFVCNNYGLYKSIKSVPTGIQIIYTPIKNEA